MLASDLLHSRVVDVDGRDVGHVHDVRLVQDGPLLGGADAAFRVDGIVVGRSSVGLRLGYHRRDMRGPWLLAVACRALDRRASYIDWTDVTQFGDGVVHVGVTKSSLPSVATI